MSEGGKEAVRLDEDVVAVIRGPQAGGALSRARTPRPLEVEILREALDLAQVKKPTLLSRSQLAEDTP